MLEIMTDAGVRFVVPDVEALEYPRGSLSHRQSQYNVAAYQLLVDKDFDAARRLALRGKELLEGTQHLYASAQSSVVLMLIDRAEGHAQAGGGNLHATLRSHARRTAQSHLGDGDDRRGTVHYHHNRLQQADALCSEVFPLLSLAPSLENFTVAHVVAARLKCAQAKYGDGLRVLDYLRSVLDGGNARRLIARVCFEKVRLWLLQDQPRRALRVLADCGQSLHLEANPAAGATLGRVPRCRRSRS